ncbi:hypothetical protein [Halopolyspora algeriensis]|nr:hypothetical protein [Halopolyspora algeriensis]
MVLLAHAGWIGVLSFAVTYRVGRFGFTPTDQGFILGTSWRLLHGEIPHQDIISARPLGSPLLHTLDFLLPGPLFFMSRLVSMVEITLFTIALAALVTRRSLLRWGPLLTGLVAAASLVNLHTHGLTAWHTVDGLMLTACGLWAVDTGLRAGRPWHYRAGLVMLGMAALTKQSFMLAAPIGMAMVLLHPAVHSDRASIGGRWLHRLGDLLILCLPGLLYIGVVTVAGGLPELIAQLTGAEPTYAQRLFELSAIAPNPLYPMLIGSGLLIVARLLTFRIGVPMHIAELGIVLAFGVLVVRLLVDGELARAGDWGIELFWLLVLACVVDTVCRRRLPWRALLVVLLAWMSSLSWGYDSPTFLGGTLALTALYLLGGDSFRLLGTVLERRGHVGWTVSAGALGMVAVLLSGMLLTRSHDASPYRDRPQGQLVADLGGVDSSLRGIRTNVDTYTYIEQIGNCVRRYPARKVAVLPDNAFAYPAFGLHNPFPMDWPRPLELVADARERMLTTAELLNREGDYLVLFQTVDARIKLGKDASVPGSVPADTEIIDYAGLEKEIKSRLTGQLITCGSFLGVWSPSL